MFHRCLLRFARATRIPCRPGTRMPHLQTSTSHRGRNRLRNYISLADYPRRDPLGPGTVNRSLALLWCGRGTRLDPYLTKRPPSATAAGASPLPNPLSAHILDHARPLAFDLARAVCHHRISNIRLDCHLLAEPQPSTVALLSAAARNHSARATSHRF